jgi:hypothetical protein
MSDKFYGSDPRKDVSRKGDEKAPTFQGSNSAGQPFSTKSSSRGNEDTTKTEQGREQSLKKTDVEEDFPEYPETHAIPVWISKESGQRLTNSQERRNRRQRKEAREKEEKEAEKEKAKLRAEFQKLNAPEPEGGRKGNRRMRQKWRRQGLLEEAKAKDDEAKAKDDEAPQKFGRDAFSPSSEPKNDQS